MSYPTDRAARQARRAGIRRRFLAAAEREAAMAGHSLVCAIGKHPPSCVGATGCLCECHDPEEAEA